MTITWSTPHISPDAQSFLQKVKKEEREKREEKDDRSFLCKHSLSSLSLAVAPEGYKREKCAVFYNIRIVTLWGLVMSLTV